MTNPLNKIANIIFINTSGVITNGMAFIIGAYLVPSLCASLILAAAIGATEYLLYVFYYHTFNFIRPNDNANYISSIIAAVLITHLFFNINLTSLILMQLIGLGEILSLYTICGFIG